MSDVGQQYYIPSYCILSPQIFLINIHHDSTTPQLYHETSPPEHIGQHQYVSTASCHATRWSLWYPLLVPLLFTDETRSKILQECFIYMFISPYLTMYSGPETGDGKFPAIHSPCKCRMTSSTRMENMTVTISIVRRILFKWGHIHTGPCSNSQSRGGSGLIRGQNTI